MLPLYGVGRKCETLEASGRLDTKPREPRHGIPLRLERNPAVLAAFRSLGMPADCIKHAIGNPSVGDWYCLLTRGNKELRADRSGLQVSGDALDELMPEASFAPHGPHQTKEHCCTPLYHTRAVATA